MLWLDCVMRKRTIVIIILLVITSAYIVGTFTEWYNSLHRYDMCMDIYLNTYMQTTKDPIPMKEWHKTECLYNYEGWRDVTGTPHPFDKSTFSEVYSWVFTPNYRDHVLEYYKVFQ